MQQYLKKKEGTQTNNDTEGRDNVKKHKKTTIFKLLIFKSLHFFTNKVSNIKYHNFIFKTLL